MAQLCGDNGQRSLYFRLTRVKSSWRSGGRSLQDPAQRVDTRPRVAVIEDDAAVRRVLSRILEDAGYGVIAMPDGETGLRAVTEHQPDMLILDLTLPRMDGLEVCRRLRAECAR